MSEVKKEKAPPFNPVAGQDLLRQWWTNQIKIVNKPKETTDAKASTEKNSSSSIGSKTNTKG